MRKFPERPGLRPTARAYFGNVQISRLTECPQSFGAAAPQPWRRQFYHSRLYGDGMPGFSPRKRRYTFKWELLKLRWMAAGLYCFREELDSRCYIVNQRSVYEPIFSGSPLNQWRDEIWRVKSGG